MRKGAAIFAGIDIGTQGARVVLIDEKGNLLASASEDFPLTEDSMQEQSPQSWWDACRRSLAKVFDECPDSRNDLIAMAVTSTSGTVIPLDENENPLHNALMYSDKRPADEGKLCRELALKYNPDGYTGFNSSSGLSKMLWYVNNFPQQSEKIGRWVHAADYITGKLSGVWGVTDHTNALKSGFDLQKNEWPEFIFDKLPMKRNWFPRVLSSGTSVGTLLSEWANAFKLPESVKIVTGITDGCASQIASGAVQPGQWNTTIGTTLVIKGVTKHELRDPLDRIYNHRHPEGYWMPGGAANIGAAWITEKFSSRLNELSNIAASLIPTGKMVYPLLGRGERFPFISPGAIGFSENGISLEEEFTASLEAVAYIERYAYEMIEKLSGEKVGAVYTAGGGSESEVWLRIRAAVLQLPVYKMKYVTGAVGAAILASSKTYFNDIIDATSKLAQVETRIEPDPILIQPYDKFYKQFIDRLKEKGIIAGEAYA